MNSKNIKSYWFDFSNNKKTLNISFYDKLIACRNYIDSPLLNINCGSVEKPIQIQFNDTYNQSNLELNKITSDMYENTTTPSFFFKIFIAIIKPFINFFFKIINNKNYKPKLDLKHYFFINGDLYITYNRSFLKFNNHKSYIQDLKNIKNVQNYYVKRNLSFTELQSFINVDIIFFHFIKKIIFMMFNSYYQFRIDYRLKQTDWGFYINNKKNNHNNFFIGLKFLWKGLKFWLIGLTMGLFIIYYLLYIRLLPFNKIIFSWLLVSMFLYWLISGFVFFIKKYQFGRFTTAIQRFWKRTYIIFWLIEAGTFSVFFYLTLNSTSEPVYMYDQIKIFKNNLFSWRWFIAKLIPSVFIILLGFYLQISLKWNLFNKQSFIIFIITLLLLHILWLEFYQFFHILNFYSNINWLFDYDEYIWTLEIDYRRTRLANSYIAICLFAKFWHFVFIVVFWIFFVLRINELNRVRYPLLVANVQNFIIIYIMSWAYMYTWFKFIFKKFVDIPYYWFFVNGRSLGIRVFFCDLKLFFYGFFNKIVNLNFYTIKFFNYPFFYWISSSSQINYQQYKKHIIRDSIISSFNSFII